MTDPESRPAPTAPDLERSRSRRRLAVLLVCLAGGLFLPELIMRWLLFGSSELARSWGADLRRPHLFADPELEDEYWRLRWTLDEADSKYKSPPHDPRLGWVNGRFDAETREHNTLDELPGRRPLLLFGASYVDCMTERPDCFERLMRDSDMAREYCLRNYGVGGYGIDQMYLLMQESLDLYAAQQPLVVIGVVLDSDLERCALGFRSWPKPRLELRDGALVEPAPVFAGGSEAYIAREGMGIWSYAWRYLLHAETQVSGPWQERLRGVERQRAEQDALIDGILCAMCEELTSRGIEHFFLLFTSPRSLPPHEPPAQEARLTRLFLERGVPFVHLRPYFLDAAQALEEGLPGLFFDAGPAKHHPNAAGNRVIFQALRDGIDGRFTTEVELP